MSGSEKKLTPEKIPTQEQMKREPNPPNKEVGKSSWLNEELRGGSSISALLLNRDGTVMAANQKAAQALGKSFDSLVGSRLYDNFPRHTAVKIRERIEEVIHAGQPLDFEEEGKRRKIRHTFYPMFDAEGSASRVAVFVCDISQHKSQGEDLYESENRYRHLVELSPDAILVHIEGKVAYTNESGAKLFGALVTEELLGKKILDFIHPEDRDFVRARIRQIYKKKTKTTLREYRICRLNGEIVEVEATGTPITYQGKPANLVIIRNISTRKQAEREMLALNKRLQKEQLHRKLLSKRLIDLLEEHRRELSMELHDRTGQSLTMLKIDLETILSELKKTGMPLQNKVEDAIAKTSLAINDLRVIAYGLMPRMIENLGIIPSIRAMLKDVEARAAVEINFFCHGLPERFNRDKELAIYRILQESLTNIVKHARAKKIFINLIEKDQGISLSIEDDGIGFEPEEKMRISRTGGPLGLHIMRERAANLGGELVIESRIGGGTHLLAEIPTI